MMTNFWMFYVGINLLLWMLAVACYQGTHSDDIQLGDGCLYAAGVMSFWPLLLLWCGYRLLHGLVVYLRAKMPQRRTDERHEWQV